MMLRRHRGWRGALVWGCVFVASWLLLVSASHAAGMPSAPIATEAPRITLGLADGGATTGTSPAVSEAIKTVVLLTALSFLPGILVSMTAFIRIVVVLSMIRHAFGMPETPPNQVLIGLALFLTLFVMLPTIDAINTNALQPLMANQLSLKDASDKAAMPLREFMLRQVHDTDLKLMYEISKRPVPADAAEVSLLQLTPAFILNELRVAFQIGFVVLLPFLLIDLVVSSVLLALGMLMVPPSTISLPLKVLMFVLIDGWTLVLEGVLGSFR